MQLVRNETKEEQEHIKKQQEQRILEDRIQRLQSKIDLLEEEIMQLEAMLKKIDAEKNWAVFALVITPVLLYALIRIFVDCFWASPIAWIVGDLLGAIGFFLWVRHWFRKIKVYMENRKPDTLREPNTDTVSIKLKRAQETQKKLQEELQQGLKDRKFVVSSIDSVLVD